VLLAALSSHGLPSAYFWEDVCLEIAANYLKKLVPPDWIEQSTPSLPMKDGLKTL